MRNQNLRRCSLLLGLCFLCVPSKTMAQQADSAFPPLEESTLGVLRLDLAHIDVEAVVKWAEYVAPEGTQLTPLRSATGPVQAFLQRLRSIDIDEIFISMPAEDVLRGAPLVSCKTTDIKAFREMMDSIWKQAFPEAVTSAQQHRGWAIFGSENAVNRVVQQKRRTTERFEQAFGSRDLHHQLLVSLSNESREDLVALWPDSPPKWIPISVSPRQLIDDLLFLRLEAALPPKSELFVEMMASDSPHATTRLREFSEQLAKLQPMLKDYFEITEQGSNVRIAVNANYAASDITSLLSRMRQSAHQSRDVNSLKQIGLALHNHFSAFEKLPELAIQNDSGEPLLSWRVKILPFVDQAALYNSIDLKKSWDDSFHEVFGQTVVWPYTSRANPSVNSVMRIPIIKGSLWEKSDTPKTFREIRDGSSNTIAVAIAPPDQAVPWMKPGGWRLDEKDLLGSFFGDRESAAVLMFDGAVLVLRKAETTEEKLRAMLTIAGREVL